MEPDLNNAAERSDPGPIRIPRGYDHNSSSDGENDSLLRDGDNSLETLRRELSSSLPGQNVSRTERAYPLHDLNRVNGVESPLEPLLGSIAPHTSPDESVSPLDSPCSERSCLLGHEPSPESSPERTPVRVMSPRDSTESLLERHERENTRPIGDESIHNSQEHVEHQEYSHTHNGYSHVPNDEVSDANNNPHADHHDREYYSYGHGGSADVFDGNEDTRTRYRDGPAYDGFDGFDGFDDQAYGAGPSQHNYQNPNFVVPGYSSNAADRGVPSNSRHRRPYVDSEQTTYINESQRGVRHNLPWPTTGNPALRRVEREYFNNNPQHQRSLFLDRQASRRGGFLGNRPAVPAPCDPAHNETDEQFAYYKVRAIMPIDPKVYKKVNTGHLRWIDKQNATGEPEIIRNALNQPHITCYESSDSDVGDWFPNGRRTVWKRLPRVPSPILKKVLAAYHPFPPPEEALTYHRRFPPAKELPAPRHSLPPAEEAPAAHRPFPPGEEVHAAGRPASQETTVSHPGSTITTVDDILHLSREADNEAARAKAADVAMEANTCVPSRASYDLGFQALRDRAALTRIPPGPINTPLAVHNPRPSSSIYSQDDVAAVDKPITGTIVDSFKAWLRWPASVECRKKTITFQPGKQSFAAFDVDGHPDTCSCSMLRDNRPAIHTPFRAYFQEFEIDLGQGKKKQLFGVGGWLENTAAILEKGIQPEKKITMVFKKTVNKVVELKSITQNLVGGTNSETRNSRTKVNPAKVTLRLREQGLVLAELEIILTEAMAFFLNREDTRHLVSMTKMKHINDQWIAEGNTVPVFFQYNLATQINICFAHLHKFTFYSSVRNNPAAVAGVLTAAKQTARVLSVRAFCQPDSVLAKLIIDSRALLLLTDEKENFQRLKDLDEVARFFYCIVHREAAIRTLEEKRTADHNEILQAHRDYRAQHPLALTSDGALHSPCDKLEKGPYFDHNGLCGIISDETFKEAAQLYMEGKTTEARNAGLFDDRYPAPSRRHYQELPLRPSYYEAADPAVGPLAAGSEIAPQLDTEIPEGALTFDSPRNTMTNRVFEAITNRSQANVVDTTAASRQQHRDESTDGNNNNNVGMAAHDFSYTSLDGTSNTHVYTDAKTTSFGRPDSPVLGAHPNVSSAVNPDGFSQVPLMGVGSGSGSGSNIGLAISHDATRSTGHLIQGWSRLSRLEPAAAQSTQDIGSQSRWSYDSNDRKLEAALANPQTPSVLTRAARRIVSHKSLRGWIGEQNSPFN